jgi:ribosomal protein S18 acetylase RimI-like enzyme
MLTTTGDVTGYRTDGLLAWIDRDPAHPMIWALGDGPAAVEFTLVMRDGVRWAHLPHLTPEQAAPLRSDRHDDWDQLTTWTAPPPAPVEGDVEPLDADAEVDALLDLAFPASVSRPGDPRVRRWYGIRMGSELVACAADRSRGGVGHIAGVAVHPDHRRRSLGTAVTAALTRMLHAEFGKCSLSVMADADGPRRVYERLGYGAPLARTTVRLAPSHEHR